MARPNKYETHVAPRMEEIKDWSRNGATDEEIAERLGISRSTLCEYKKEFSEFSDALKQTKALVDARVENALLKRALGYEYEEVTKERNGDGNLEVTKIVKKQVVPDVTAQIYWLKNRKPKQWRDKIEISGEVEHKVDVPASVKSLTLDMLRSIAAGIVAPSTKEFDDESGGTEQGRL